MAMDVHHKQQVLVKDCLEVPNLLTARVFSIFIPHFQGIWEMECLSPRKVCPLLHYPASVPYLFV